MIYSTATVPVNPEGEAELTRAQVWAGLELKARDAREFLPPGLCTRCRSSRRARPTSFARLPSPASTSARSSRLSPTPRSRSSRRRGARGRHPSTNFSKTTPARSSSASTANLGLRGKEANGPEEQSEQAQFDGDTATAALSCRR